VSGCVPSIRVARVNIVAGVRHMAEVAVADMEVCVPANLVETGEVEAGNAQGERD